MEKIILDVCCGPRMMWFDKNNPLAVFMDIREEKFTACDGRFIVVAPDIVADYTNIPFNDGSFKIVVFDPPHLNRVGEKSYTAQKYGRLLPTWETDLKAGFDECMRVLENFGILIFKWNETQIPINRILNIFGVQPLFGHKSGKLSKTHWMCFIKTPEPGNSIQYSQNLL